MNIKDPKHMSAEDYEGGNFRGVYIRLAYMNVLKLKGIELFVYATIRSFTESGLFKGYISDYHYMCSLIGASKSSVNRALKKLLDKKLIKKTKLAVDSSLRDGYVTDEEGETALIKEYLDNYSPENDPLYGMYEKLAEVFEYIPLPKLNPLLLGDDDLEGEDNEKGAPSSQKAESAPNTAIAAKRDMENQGFREKTAPGYRKQASHGSTSAPRRDGTRSNPATRNLGTRPPRESTRERTPETLSDFNMADFRGYHMTSEEANIALEKALQRSYGE